MSLRLSLCVIFSAFSTVSLFADSPEGSTTSRQSPSSGRALTLGSSLVSQVQAEDKSIDLPEIEATVTSPSDEQSIAVTDAQGDVQSMVQGGVDGGCTSAQSAFNTRRCEMNRGKAYKSSQFSYQIWQGYAEQRAREEQHKIETVLSPCIGGNCSSTGGHGFKLHSKHWLPKHQINGTRASVSGKCDQLITPVRPPELPAAALKGDSSFR